MFRIDFPIYTKPGRLPGDPSPEEIAAKVDQITSQIFIPKIHPGRGGGRIGCEPWQEEETRQFKVDWESDISDVLLCKRYRRTLKAIRSKAWRMGLSKRHGR